MIRHLKLVTEGSQSTETNLLASPIKTFSVKSLKESLAAVPLNRISIGELAEIKSKPVLACALVGMAHALLIASILFLKPKEIEKKEEPKPILVSLVSNPAPEPELVPLMPPPPPKVKQKLVEKKVVKNVEQKQPEPVPQVQEQAVEQVVQEVQQEVVQETKAANVVEAAKSVAKEEPKQPEPEPEIEPPRFGVAYLNNPAPNYPNLSKRMGEEGRVLLRVLVSASGKAESVELEKSSGYERLDNAAIDVVKKWSFIPAKKGKEVLSAYVLVPVKFTLN